MIYALFALFVILQIADAASTVIALRYGATEANPAMRKVMEQVGVTQALVFMKLAGILLIGIFIWLGWMTEWVLALCCAFYVAILANNIIQIRKG